MVLIKKSLHRVVCLRVLPPILDVARMAFDDFLSQAVIFYVAIDFGSGDVFVSQHSLDSP